ncbi:phosphonate ABC transporter permease [Arthrobacter sp. ERGS1:01]|uniref:phosphonate ABC transporter, permease protein PhnE n=1 Tax=Arthrobacter sp. ERGS1:01 TaxID=1704044 RepID=UPI0006B5C2EF|nr:phosphonate ABC transporter, permease protein PhnE [Arthrobacter sp. ERGS1:01]ALE06511.1 phosphonate ABC transporter permease [Arthrobacter sp. ERGS1:01]
MSAAATPATPVGHPGGQARPTKPRHGAQVGAAVVVLAGITLWAGIGVRIDLPAIWTNWHNATANIVQLLQPDYGFFPKTIPALLETLQMAVIATAAGSAVSLPLAFLASRATNPRSGLLRGVRLVMNMVRSVPDILYAAILVAVVGVGALSGIMALFMFNIGIIVKLVSEALDGEDAGAQEAALAAGASWPQASRAAMLPQILPSFASQVLYTFELNIRASTVIGLVGAGGLGILIDNVRSFFRYHELSMIILEILLLVLVLESVSSWLRKKLV